MAGKEPLLSALRGENNPGGSSVWGLSRGSPRQGVSCLALHDPLFALAAPTPRYKEVFWSFSPLPGWVSPCSHPGHLPRCLPRAVRSPNSPPPISLSTQGCCSSPPAGEVLRFREAGGPCPDTSPHLASICQLLEGVLRKGLRRECAWAPARSRGSSVPPCVPPCAAEALALFLWLFSSHRAGVGLAETGLLALPGAAFPGGRQQVSGDGDKAQPRSPQNPQPPRGLSPKPFSFLSQQAKSSLHQHPKSRHLPQGADSTGPRPLLPTLSAAGEGAGGGPAAAGAQPPAPAGVQHAGTPQDRHLRGSFLAASWLFSLSFSSTTRRAPSSAMKSSWVSRGLRGGGMEPAAVGMLLRGRERSWV